ncbi:MAG: serine hydrolase [Chitinophagales bacterium]|nr:serine hydrolase [Chitinophagales bacterium]MDW8392906.1 serine hydrolase [Chitinophagales bacterium]
MNLRLFFLLLALGASQLLTVAVLAQPIKKKLNRLDSLLSAKYPAAGPGGVVLVAENFKPLFHKAYGLANVELNVPNRLNTVFPIGSMSKQFAAVAVLRLAETGKLSLTDSVSRYVPEMAEQLAGITVEQLLNHTSGLMSYTEVRGFEEKFRSPLHWDDLLDLVRDSALLFRPGTDWSYTNTGYLLAARIVEKVSGQPYQQFVRLNLLEPAQMRETTFGSGERIIPQRAYNYLRTDSLNCIPGPYFDWSWTLGAGDILSTTGDLMRWYQALVSGKILSPASLQKAWMPARLADGRSVNYGLGWMTDTLGSTVVIGHGGALPGYLSDALFVPQRNLLIVLLSNSSAPPPSEIVERALMRLLNIPRPLPGKLSAERLGEYAGVYERHRKGARLIRNYGAIPEYYYVSVSGDTLMVQPSGGSRNPVFASGRDTFYTRELSQRIIFLRNETEKIFAVQVEGFPLHYGLPDIGLRTDLPLPEQRQTQAITAEQLRPYTGTYELQKGFNLMVFSRGDTLFIQATGQGPLQLHNESKHRFFLKEVDAQAEFVPDADGIFRTMLFTQGQQFRCRRISDEVAVMQRKEQPVTYEQIKDYLGSYELQKGFFLHVLWEDGKLWLQPTGQPRYELFSETDTRFFLKVVDASMEFHRNAGGTVTGMTYTQGRSMEAPKVK